MFEFSGLVTYVSKFIPDLSTVTFPLRSALKKDEKFVWTNEKQAAFDKIKELMCNTKVLAYFNPSDRTRLIADASPVGLGAVLIQFKNGEPRVISFAAKSLTETERRYCQTEKEALALVWAVEKFQTYLMGINFELETDHKPLESIFAPKSRPSARIERWVLRLQAFRFKVVYRKGSANLADSLSRLVVKDPVGFDEESENYINSVISSAAIDIDQVERASEADETLQKLKVAIDDNNYEDPLLLPYKYFHQELSYSGNIIIRQSQVVIPKSLRTRVLDLGHEGHPGEGMMKRRLRAKCWWPKLDEDVKKYVKTCKSCALVANPSRPEPMTRRQLPMAPWVDVAIDFLGPLPTKEYVLVIIDYYSRYLEVEIMRSITAEATIERLDKIFTRLGFPRTITLDNAKQFVSSRFTEYCKDNGIYLNNTCPYWPQANGEVERQNRTLLKRLQIGHAQTGNWKSELNQFLMLYYTTPHSVTNKTPSELMQGRTIRSKLPQITDLQTAPNRQDFVDRDMIFKEKGKERVDKQRHAIMSDIQVGDTVLQRNLLKDNKLTTKFGPQTYTVMDRKGSIVTIRNDDTGVMYDRHVVHVKKVVERVDEHPIDNMEPTSTNMESDEEDFYGFSDQEQN